jgi:hypothetical protein
VPLSRESNKPRETFHDRSCVIDPGTPQPVVLLPAITLAKPQLQAVLVEYHCGDIDLAIGSGSPQQESFDMLAVMYLQRGPPIAENESTTHRTHRTHR